MSERSWTKLADRGVIAVSGLDAAGFLQGLLTADIEALAPGMATLAALLTPQGKILFDGLVLRGADGYLIDCRKEIVADFTKRLTFYKLRAKVDVTDSSGELAAAAFWPGGQAGTDRLFADPRDALLGFRAIAPATQLADIAQAWGAAPATLEDYHRHRIQRAIPEGGLDFAYGDAFPHETDMDKLAGVSFSKGCYVGQEVVSRMQHRGTARTRIMPVEIVGDGQPGSEISADGRKIGTLGSVAGNNGLATLRIDKVQAALEAGHELVAGAARLLVRQPDWAQFDIPALTGGTHGQA